MSKNSNDINFGSSYASLARLTPNKRPHTSSVGSEGEILEEGEEPPPPPKPRHTPGSFRGRGRGRFGGDGRGRYGGRGRSDRRDSFFGGRGRGGRTGDPQPYRKQPRADDRFESSSNHKFEYNKFDREGSSFPSNNNKFDRGPSFQSNNNNNRFQREASSYPSNNNNNNNNNNNKFDREPSSFQSNNNNNNNNNSKERIVPSQYRSNDRSSQYRPDDRHTNNHRHSGRGGRDDTYPRPGRIILPRDQFRRTEPPNRDHVRQDGIRSPEESSFRNMDRSMDRQHESHRSPDDDRRMDNNRRPDDDRMMGSNRRPEDDHLMGSNSRRPDDEDRIMSNRRRPDDDRMMSNNRRPEDDRMMNNNRRPEDDRMMNNNRRPEDDRMMNNNRRPEDDRMMNNNGRTNDDRMMGNLPPAHNRDGPGQRDDWNDRNFDDRPREYDRQRRNEPQDRVVPSQYRQQYKSDQGYQNQGDKQIRYQTGREESYTKYDSPDRDEVVRHYSDDRRNESDRSYTRPENSGRGGPRNQGRVRGGGRGGRSDYMGRGHFDRGGGRGRHNYQDQGRERNERIIDLGGRGDSDGFRGRGRGDPEGFRSHGRGPLARGRGRGRGRGREDYGNRGQPPREREFMESAERRRPDFEQTGPGRGFDRGGRQARGGPAGRGDFGRHGRGRGRHMGRGRFSEPGRTAMYIDSRNRTDSMERPPPLVSPKPPPKAVPEPPPPQAPPTPPKTPSPPPTPPPEPAAEPSGLVKALTRLADMEAQMEFEFAKLCRLEKQQESLRETYDAMSGMGVGIDAFRQEYDEYVASLTESKEGESTDKQQVS